MMNQDPNQTLPDDRDATAIWEPGPSNPEELARLAPAGAPAAASGASADTFQYEFAGRSFTVRNNGAVDWTLDPSITQYIRRETLIPDPDNPRRFISEGAFTSIIDSITAYGVLTELVVRPGTDGHPILIGGHTRLVAATQAGQEFLPCKIRPDVQGGFAARLAMFQDNGHRTEIAPIDQALEFAGLMAAAAQEGKPLDITELSKATKVSQTKLRNSLELLELPEPVQQLVNNGTLTLANAYTLLQIKEGNSQEEIDAARCATASKMISGEFRDSNRWKGRLNDGPGRSGSGPRKITRPIDIGAGDIRVNVTSPKLLSDSQVIAALEKALEVLKGSRQVPMK